MALEQLKPMPSDDEPELPLGPEAPSRESLKGLAIKFGLTNPTDYEIAIAWLDARQVAKDTPEGGDPSDDMREDPEMIDTWARDLKKTGVANDN
jgi:hypothetical protein